MKKIFQKLGYILSYPFAKLYKGFRILYEWDAPGVITFLIMISFLICGWREVHYSHANILFVIFKYSIFATFAISISTAILSFMLDFFLRVLEPMDKFNSKCKSVAFEEKMEIDDYIRKYEKVKPNGLI